MSTLQQYWIVDDVVSVETTSKEGPEGGIVHSTLPTLPSPLPLL